jgi:predicted HAD superfamily Cof-like phosphohydrolase
MVKELNKLFGHPAPDYIKPIRQEQRMFRARWMVEEILEFALEKDIIGQAKELIDIIVFALGALAEMGVDPQELFDAVHDSNLSKLGPDGKLNHDPITNKVIKPTTYTPAEPEMNRILQERMRAEAEDVPF